MKTLFRFWWLPALLCAGLVQACGSSGDTDPGVPYVPPGTGGTAGAPADAGFDAGGECINGRQEPCGSDVGACVPGFRTCTNQTWGPCLNSVGPAEETCDGMDHDCDGIPNNPAAGCECTDGETRPCYNGPPGTEGVGTCQAGTDTCLNGAWGGCIGAVEPEPGRCDVLSCTGDPNPGCECVVGQTRPCFSGPPTAINVGICQEGSQECEANATGAAWGLCVGEVVPETERCDGQDHDCNGVPNDAPGGCACTPGTTQPCYTGPASTLGVGTCAEGSQSCILSSGTYTWGPCQGDIAPVPGDCDRPSCTGVDDPNPGCNCINGRSETCYSGPPGTEGVGACVGGLRTCVSGAWGGCTGQIVPAGLDQCVPFDAVYAGNQGADLTCNGALDRHAPNPTPTVTAPTGSPVPSLPASYVDGVQVLPLDTATFHGAGTDPEGGPLGYRWRLISAPAGNTAGLSGAPGATPTDFSTEQNPTLFAQLVGDYEVGMRATDSTGCESVEARLLLRVKPNTAVHVQLTWDESADIDLHLVREPALPFSDPDDCFWANPNPDWGVVDPSLDIDDLAGCNPENIHFGEFGGPQPPLNTEYSVWAHYWCAYRGHRFTYLGDPTTVCYEPGSEVQAPAVATIRVYIDGQLAKIDGTNRDAEFSQWLYYGDAWVPALLRYDNAGLWKVLELADPLYYAEGCLYSTLDPTTTGCECGQLPNASDPYCGANGAACRSLYP